MRVPLPPAFLTTPLAHRGLHNRANRIIENSASAIRAAVAAGYGIEVDLQLSLDGVPMVFHDETLDRLTAEHGWVNTRTAAELAQITLTDSADIIPTLDHILTLIAGRVPLLIELKDQSLIMADTDGRLSSLSMDSITTMVLWPFRQRYGAGT